MLTSPIDPAAARRRAERDRQLALLGLLEERDRRRQRRQLQRYFPDTGPHRRALYAKHLAFFAAGATHRERCFMAANRVGKTESAGGYEMALHLTGRYPDWWPGRRFDRPVSAWAAGDTNETSRDILQRKLLGAAGDHGTGLIPGDDLIRTTPRSGVSGAVLDIYVRHCSGGMSVLTLKSYEQGRKKFQGTEIDVVWLDEEPPSDIYGECLTRTMTTGGLVMLTFTPLSGMSEVVMSYLEQREDDRATTKALIQAGWDDVPHLSEDDKAELKAGLPPHEIEARSTGAPSLGSGAIYPVPAVEITVAPFALPDYWPRAYALDVGWNRTAALWGARDPNSGIIYIYTEHYRGQAEPAVHAQAIQARGAWIAGVIDPAARGRAQADGRALIDSYRDLGLDLDPANNAVEAGIHQVWQRLSGGSLKVFATCRNLLSEYRLYRRDADGRIVKRDDHLMDCLRYLVVSGIERMRVRPQRAGEAVLPTGGDKLAGY